MISSFNLFDYPIVLSQPRRLTEIDNWHLHTPFAFFIVALQRPQLFVELGTHRGDSYSAFCQAVAELAFATRCVAIDHWKGDAQAGPYDEEIYDELRRYHDPLYGQFSKLLRSSFDEAAANFADGSIDLLHIDGLHTYESVRHDYETWLPKMSRRGVVLLHDTRVRERGFGVWKLWEEQSALFPSIEFSFGFGLGVLAIGKDRDDSVLSFFREFNDSKGLLEKFFLRLGMASALFALKEKLETEVLRCRQGDTAALEESRHNAEQLAIAKSENACAQQAIQECARAVRELHSSRSWKMTAPLRSCHDALAGMAQRVRKKHHAGPS